MVKGTAFEELNQSCEKAAGYPQRPVRAQRVTAAKRRTMTSARALYARWKWARITLAKTLPATSIAIWRMILPIHLQAFTNIIEKPSRLQQQPLAAILRSPNHE
ncbi:hypothetical protein DSC83_23475 [Salmonella enterica]|nr:hypothetical protein [Salmonella enterica]